MAQPYGTDHPRGWDLLITLRWPLCVFFSTVAASSILGYVIHIDDEVMHMGPIKIELKLDQAVPVEAQVKGIHGAVELKPLQANVAIPRAVAVNSPVTVSVPQLQKPLHTKVDGNVEASVTGNIKTEVTGGVDTKVQGPVEVEIPKPIKHEKIRLGLFGL